jgi:hypothetical protein
MKKPNELIKSVFSMKDSPLTTPLALQRKLAEDEVARARELQATEGFLLKNLEKDCKNNKHLNVNTINKSNFDFQLNTLSSITL